MMRLPTIRISFQRTPRIGTSPSRKMHSPLEIKFKAAEVLIPVKDNQHPWEKAYVGVLSHPFFAVRPVMVLTGLSDCRRANLRSLHGTKDSANRPQKSQLASVRKES